MQESKYTIKQTYNKYASQDFNYFEKDSVNLNPKREISFDQLDKIVQRLQEVTDDIIRKKIEPIPEDREMIQSAVGGESFPDGIPIHKQMLLNQSGGIGNAVIFPVISKNFDTVFLMNGKLKPNSANRAIGLENLLEEIIGTFPVPELLNELDVPIALDCEFILQKFDSDTGGDKGGGNNEDSPGSGSGGGGNNGGVGGVPGSGPGGNSPTTAPDSSGDNTSGGGGSGAGLGDEGGSDDSSEDVAEPNDYWDDGSVDPNEDPNAGNAGDDSTYGPDEEDEENYQDELDYQAETELAECGAKELALLKILLVLVKLIKIIKTIIELVLAIIFPLIDILHLAAGAWINPPNIPKIFQLIMELVTALIQALTGMILQMLWDLLNLDCVVSQVGDMIDQINRAMSTFKSIMNAFDPKSIGLLASKLEKDIKDPIAEIMKNAQASKEAWADFGKNAKQMMKDTFNAQKLKEQALNSLEQGLKNGANDFINGPAGSAIAGLANSAEGAVNAGRDAWKASKDAMSRAKNVQAEIAAGYQQSGGGAEVAAMSDPSIRLDTATSVDRSSMGEAD